MSAEMNLRGDKELVRSLKRLGNQSGRAMNKAARASFVPMQKDAKRLTPVQSGLLKASIGIVRRSDKRTGTITVELGPRRKFSKTKAGVRTRITGGEAQAPVKYAHFIEFGFHKGGRKQRTEPQLMLTEAFDNKKSKVIPTLADHIRKQLRKIARKA